MESAFESLLDELERGILNIDLDESSSLEKTLAKIELCRDLTGQLRTQFLSSSLETEEEQIQFFSTTKPRFFSELFFQHQVLNYFKTMPKGDLKSKKQHINTSLAEASMFIQKHCEFHHYVQLRLTHMDHLYFTMRPYCPKLHGSFEYPSDPDFSSPADPTKSCLLAAERFIEFLKLEEYALRNPTLDPSWEFSRALTWQRSKTDLVELVYALHATGAIGGELKECFEVLGRAFNTDVGNFYRTYTDIKYKKNHTSFLDDLKNGLLTKIRSEY